MMTEVSLPLAEAHVHDDIDLRDLVAGDAQVRADKPVRLRFAYRFEERSAAEEAWFFRLSVRIGKGPELISERRHEDRRSRLDDTVANLHHDVKFPAGDHEVKFTAEAEITIRDWQGTSAAKRIHKKVGKTFRVRAT